jgi:sodium/potassium-transporting ATPase subunit alpha
VIDYTPVGHLLFGTAAIGWHAWLIVLPFAATMLILEEGRKAFVRSACRAPSMGQGDVRPTPDVVG